MLRVHRLEKAMAGRTVLRGVSFVANDGAPVGIVGPNGSGKTTLLRLIAGQLQPDSGRIEMPPGTRVELLRQGYAGCEREPLRTVFPRVSNQGAEQELERVGAELAGAEDEERRVALEGRFAELLAIVERDSGSQVDELRAGLRVGAWDPDMLVGMLSGGELAKLGLVELFARDPTALLLDEPTNHLDLDALKWLEDRVRLFPGPAVVVSHDRAFLDAVATQVVAFDASGHAEVYSGSYSDYAEEVARHAADQQERYERQERERGRLQRSIQAAETRSRGIEQRTINFHYRKRALKVARRAVTLRARLERQLESADHVDRPERGPQGLHAATFAQAPRSANRLVEARSLALGVGDRTLVENADFVIGREQRIVLVGPNGSGKTTLLRALLGEYPPSAGEVRVTPSARIGYLPQDDLELLSHEAETPVEVIRKAVEVDETEAFNLLHRFLFGHDRAFTPLRQLSYGERRRLSLARLILGGTNLLLLDEPTNHLDLPSRESFEAALESFDGAWLAVTHDRYFAERLAEQIWAIEDGRLVILEEAAADG
jgi:ATP-binding cassette subfamily F protein 3